MAIHKYPLLVNGDILPLLRLPGRRLRVALDVLFGAQTHFSARRVNIRFQGWPDIHSMTDLGSIAALPKGIRRQSFSTRRASFTMAASCWHAPLS